MSGLFIGKKVWECFLYFDFWQFKREGRKISISRGVYFWREGGWDGLDWFRIWEIFIRGSEGGGLLGDRYGEGKVFCCRCQFVRGFFGEKVVFVG